MSRYYPLWYVLSKAGILAIGLPVIFYLAACNGMSLHYRHQVDRYDDAALAISDGWPKLQTFDDYHVCVAGRYLAAGSAATDYHEFSLIWMIRNWNKDFLAEQPSCDQRNHAK